GSPGTMRTSTKASVSTANSVGIRVSSRCPTKRSMCPPSVLLLQLCQFGHGRAEMHPRLQVVTPIDIVAPRISDQLFIKRHCADLLNDLLLSGCPKLLLNFRIGFRTRLDDLLISHIAMREVDRGGRRPHDGCRVEELRQEHISN